MSTAIGLSPRTIEIVKSSVPALQQHGVELTRAFYALMFKRNPEVLSYFNRANQRKDGNQPVALAQTVLAAAQSIENLPAILPAIQHIGHKHRSLDITPELYPIVGENLLLAMKEVFGEVANDEFISAWAETYGVIADVFINMEKQMNAEVVANKGWEGYKQFVITKKNIENELVTSFYLQAKDGKQLPTHQAGQYISIRFMIPELGYMQPRQYSLSMAPNEETYRISVKREKDGLISNKIHDELQVGDVVEITAPAGEFVLLKNEKPVVLFGAGIGVTPMMSMLLDSLTETKAVYMVQAVENSAVHTFKEDIRAIAQENDHVTHTTFYQSPLQSDVKGTDYEEEGIITKEWIATHLPLDATFYMCGPTPFMKHIHDELIELGVQREQIKYEVFGPNTGL